MSLGFLGSKLGTAVIEGEFGFGGAFRSAFEETHDLGDVLVLWLILVVVVTKGWLDWDCWLSDCVQYFSVGVVEGNGFGVDRVVVVWVGGFRAGHRRERGVVRFANTEECDCDLVVGWHSTKDIAAAN